MCLFVFIIYKGSIPMKLAWTSITTGLWLLGDLHGRWHGPLWYQSKIINSATQKKKNKPRSIVDTTNTLAIYWWLWWVWFLLKLVILLVSLKPRVRCSSASLAATFNYAQPRGLRALHGFERGQWANAGIFKGYYCYYYYYKSCFLIAVSLTKCPQWSIKCRRGPSLWQPCGT